MLEFYLFAVFAVSTGIAREATPSSWTTWFNYVFWCLHLWFSLRGCSDYLCECGSLSFRRLERRSYLTEHNCLPNALLSPTMNLER